jgi:hypothetical protein
MANHFNQPSFNPGGIPDKPDARDYKWKEELGGAAAPFDWNKGYDIEAQLQSILGNPEFKLTPNDQNGSGSCGGQAWSKYAAVLKAVVSKTFANRSAKFIYSQTFQAPAGSAGRDNCNILLKQGCASESLCPSYDNNQPPTEAFMEQRQDITLQATADAKFDEALSYANVALDIDDFAQAIENNYGMVIGVRGTNAGWMPTLVIPPTDADMTPTDTTWGHWIYAGKARLNNGQKQIGILNSWGNSRGDNGDGWQWIGENYFAEGGKFLMSGWTHVINTNPTPPASSFKYNFANVMSSGMNNADVKALQQALQIDEDFPVGVAPTGIYGNITCQAVLKFQIKYQVASTAELNSLGGKTVGPATLAKLNQLFNK